MFDYIRKHIFQSISCFYCYFQIPIYKGATEALINHPIEFNYYHGKNGMGNVKFWKPEYPSDENEMVQPESAAQKIRDLIIKVSLYLKIRFSLLDKSLVK